MTEVPALDSLEPDDRDLLLSHAKNQSYEAGSYIIKKGEKGEALYIVESGSVRVPVIDTGGHLRFTAVMGVGELFGEMALLIDRPRSADVIVNDEGDCTCWVLDLSTVQGLMHERPAVARFLTEILGKRLLESDHMRRLGKYEIQRPMSRGGMSLLFEGYHAALDRQVAIKMLPHELIFAGDFVEQFRSEARMIAGLRHPNIVEVYDVEEAYRTWFIVMELLRGEDLYQRIRRTGPMEFETMRHVLRQTAAALHYAHNFGVVHRDIKPSNVFIEDGDQVKLLDFGIAARISPSGVTTSEQFLGTPSYSAPEMFQGGPIDARSDIYSLGIMTYLMLTARQPFRGKDTTELFHQHLSAPIPNPRLRRPDAPRDLVELINRATSKKPADRFDNCAEIIALLGESEGPGLHGSSGRGLTVIFNSKEDKLVGQLLEDCHRRLEAIPGARVVTYEIPSGAQNSESKNELGSRAETTSPHASPQLTATQLEAAFEATIVPK